MVFSFATLVKKIDFEEWLFLQGDNLCLLHSEVV